MTALQGNQSACDSTQTVSPSNVNKVSLTWMHPVSASDWSTEWGRMFPFCQLSEGLRTCAMVPVESACWLTLHFLREAAFSWNILADLVYFIGSFWVFRARLQDVSAVWRSRDICSAARLAFQWLQGDVGRVSRYSREALKAGQRKC